MARYLTLYIGMPRIDPSAIFLHFAAVTISVSLRSLSENDSHIEYTIQPLTRTSLGSMAQWKRWKRWGMNLHDTRHE